MGARDKNTTEHTSIDDHGFTPEIRKKAEETLAARKGTKNEVDYEFHVYEGQFRISYCTLRGFSDA